MCLAQGPQRSDAGEARTRGPSVSSQAHYHWATALLWKRDTMRDLKSILSIFRNEFDKFNKTEREF